MTLRGCRGRRITTGNVIVTGSPPLENSPERRLVKEIEDIHDTSGGTYGSPRVTVELRRRGLVVNHKRTERLMQIHNIVGHTPHKRRTTTIGDGDHLIPDRVQRDFTPDGLDVTWCGDISYISTWEGFLYLGFVEDLASRRILGLSMANHMRAVLVGDALIEAELRGLRTAGLVKRCAGFRNSPNRSVDEACARAVMRAVARRISHLNDEITLHTKALVGLVDQAAPQLIAEVGIGPVTAAGFYIAWSHPGRCRNEAAYARLGGAAPILVTSGQTQDRHRLSRRGDRQLNKALHQVAVTRLRCHEPTQAYKARRSAEGKTDREIRRCIKRYIARRVWRLLEHQPPQTTT